MENALTTRQAARSLGVSQASLKRWCDRGRIAAERTPGGHRRIAPDDVLAFARAHRLPVRDAGLLGLPESAVRPEDVTRARSALDSALERGDEPAARRAALSAYASGLELTELLDGWIAPTFARLGERWAHGSLSVFQERRAVELCTRVLHDVRAAQPEPPADAPRAIGTTLAGDPYTLAALLVELGLRERRWSAQTIGFQLPARAVVDAIRAVRPRLVWLSVSAPQSADAFAAEYRQVYLGARQVGAAMLIGGRGLTPKLLARIEFSAYARTVREAMGFADALAAALAAPNEPRT